MDDSEPPRFIAVRGLVYSMGGDVTPGQTNSTASFLQRWLSLVRFLVVLSDIKKDFLFISELRSTLSCSWNSLLKFPGDKALLKRWLHVMKQQDWTPTKFSLICSRHFTDDCYEKNGWSSQRKLKPTAVPSIFTFSEKVDIRKKLRPRPPVQNQSSTITAKNSAEVGIDDQAHNGPQMKKRKIKSPSKSNTPSKSSNTSKKTSQSELKVLQENNKLLKRKLSNLEALVKYLKEKSVEIKPASKRVKKKGSRHLGIKNWKAMVQQRREWQTEVVETVKALTQL